MVSRCFPLSELRCERMAVGYSTMLTCLKECMALVVIQIRRYAHDGEGNEYPDGNVYFV